MDSFANLTSLLAEERKAIESTVRNLGSVSSDAFDLLSVNRAGLDKDLTELTRVLQSVKANIGSVQQLLDAGPLLVNGLQNAYSPTFHRVDLRVALSPTVSQALGNLGLGFTVCLPIDVNCTPGSSTAASAAAPPAPAPAAAPAPGPAPPQPVAPAAASVPSTPGPTTSTTAAPPNPIDSILRLFGSGGAHVGVVSSAPAAKAADAAGGVGDFLKGVARALTGVLG
jgi:hypothetical protein